MKTKIDIELIVAYIKGEIKSSQKKDEICELIQTDNDWFSAYIDLKTSIVELESTKFEVTPDQLLNPKEEIQTKEVPVFDFKWLLRPQLALGAACMLIVVVFLSINREVDDFDLFPSSTLNTSKDFEMMSDDNEPSSGTRSAKPDKSMNRIVKIDLTKKSLRIFNTSTDQLSISIDNQGLYKEFELGMFDSSEIDLLSGENRIIVVNSEMETVQDTTITINE
jgi:hypothetical protein